MKAFSTGECTQTTLITESEMNLCTALPDKAIAKDPTINAAVTADYLRKIEKADKAHTRKIRQRAGLSISLLNVLLVFFVFSSIKTNAQSRNYWSQNFNTESSLVAGAVVGGDAGPSAVYYNPALINKNELHKFAFSANLFSFQNLKLENIASQGTQYDKFKFQVQPKFVSYSWEHKKNPKLTFEAAFLVPSTYNIEFTYLYNEQLEIINRLDGEEEYTGKIGYKYKYDDYFLGLGISKKISDRFTMGASSFFSIKVQDYANTVSRKAMQNSDTVFSNGVPEPFYSAENTYSELMNYFDVSLLFKLGLHYRSANENWGVGLNITTPNLSIYGSGDVTKEFERSNIFDNSTNQFAPNLSFLSSQEKIGTKIKNPLSIALGLQYTTPNRENKFMFTTEYFMAIDPYKMLNTTDSKVVGNLQLENVDQAMTYYTSANAVLNAGVGFVKIINEKLTINGGFKTDFTTTKNKLRRELDDPDGNPRLSILHFDKLHFMAGPSLQFEKIGLVLGVQYTTGGANDQYNLTTFSNPVEYDPATNAALQGQISKDMNIKYSEVSLFFGITYGIAK